MEEKINLTKGEIRKIGLLFGEGIIYGEYLGNAEDYNIFVNNENNQKKYIFMVKHWTEKRGNTLTYYPGSSISIPVVTTQEIKKGKHSNLESALIKLGEKI